MNSSQRPSPEEWRQIIERQRRHGRQSCRTRNRRVAEQKAWELENRLARGEHNPEKKDDQKPVSIDDAITAFIAAKRTDGCARKTIIKYEGELKNLSKFASDKFGVRTIVGISLILMDKYKLHRREEDHLDLYTIYNHLIILKTWLKWCRKRKLIEANPLEELEIAQPRRRRHPAASFQQLEAILKIASGCLFAVTATLAFAGLRIGELIALRPECVDLKERLIHVRAHEGWGPKTESSERDVPIHPRLFAILEAMKPLSSSHFFTVQPSRRHTNGDHHLNPRDVNEHFKQLAKKAGFVIGRDKSGLTLHALRRFFKTYCLDSGVPKPMVDCWMGHRNQSDMDSFYYDPQKSKEWMDRVQFGPPCAQDIARLADPNKIGVAHEKDV